MLPFLKKNYNRFLFIKYNKFTSSCLSQTVPLCSPIKSTKSVDGGLIKKETHGLAIDFANIKVQSSKGIRSRLCIDHLHIPSGQTICNREKKLYF